MKVKRLSNELLAVCALYELGGSHKKVRTEDIAIHLFRQYPSRFCIEGYPQYPELEKARKALMHAKYFHLGQFTEGTNVRGWTLTAEGVSWVKNNAAQVAGEMNQANKETAAELNRIEKSSLMKDWIAGRAIKNEYSLPEVLGLPVDASEKHISDHYTRIKAAVADTNNEQMEEFLTWLA